jgi:hypothetical protein
MPEEDEWEIGKLPMLRVVREMKADGLVDVPFCLK